MKLWAGLLLAASTGGAENLSFTMAGLANPGHPWDKEAYFARLD